MDSNEIAQAIYKRLISDLARLFKNDEPQAEGEDKTFPLPAAMIETMKAGLEKINGMDDVPAFVEAVERIVKEGAARAEDARAAREVWTQTGGDANILYMLWGESGDGEGRKQWDKIGRSLEKADIQQTKPSGFAVEKDLQGNWRWFGWATNNFIDRENEILTDSAHREFLKFLDENPEKAPELWSWHTPGTARKHRADWWDYSHGFFTYSGVLTEEEAQGYLNLSDHEKEIGMSHGFHVLDRKGPFITRYRTFEVSDLPLDLAANPHTAFTTFEQLKEEEKMFSDRKRAYLISQLGEERVAQLEGNTEEQEKALLDLGVTRKELDAQYEEHLETELANKIATAATEQSKGIVDAVLKQVIEALNIPGLQETLSALDQDIQATKEFGPRLEALEESVKQLKETEDQKIAEAFAPVQPFSWTLAASRADDTEVKEDDLSEEEQEEAEKVAKGGNGQFAWLRNIAATAE